MDNEVYVLVHEWQFDTGETGIVVRVYDSLEKAKEQLDIEYEFAKKEWSTELFPDSWNVESSDMSFSFWESDEYCYNHETFTIFQREVM